MTGWQVVAAQARQAADIAWFPTILLTLIGWLPAASAVLTFVWACFRLYELKTIQKWIAKRKRS